MVRDDSNPRSVAFQLAGLSDVLARIDRALGGAGSGLAPPALAGLGPLEDPSALVPEAALADRLDAIAQAAGALSDRLSLRFFAHVDDRNRATFAA